MARNYNQSDPVGSSSSMINGKTGLPSLGGFLDDFLNSFIFGDPSFSSDLWDEISGKNSQMREFEQQEYLMDKQNEYNSPENQMARMRAAGINPNTAAAGIAGAGSTSAQPQPVSNNTAGASNALSSIAGALGSFGGAAKDFADAGRTNELLDFEKRKMSAETSLALENAGLSHWQAVSVAELLPYQTANQRADFYLKLANIDETTARYNNLLAEHRNILATYDEILSRKALNVSETDVNNAQKAVLEENARWQKAENDFWEQEGYLRNQPSDMALRNCVVNGKTDNAENIGNAIENSSNRSHTGYVEAEKHLQEFVSNLKLQNQKAVDENRISLEKQKELDLLAEELANEVKEAWNAPSRNPFDMAEKLISRFVNMWTREGRSRGSVPVYAPTNQ